MSQGNQYAVLQREVVNSGTHHVRFYICDCAPVYSFTDQLKSYKLSPDFRRLLHNNCAPDEVQASLLQHTSLKLSSHLLCVKSDIKYFLDAIQDLQVSGHHEDTLSFFTELRSVCESSGTHQLHLCSECGHHLLLHDFAPSLNNRNSCSGVRISKTIQDRYNNISTLITQLHFVYTDITRILDDYKKILSPIRYLPRDVLGEIFLHTGPDGFVVFDVSSPPWVLGHICKDWRNAVVSIPSLWSHMLLWPQNHVCDPVNLMRTALTRSSNHLLTIRYDYWPDHFRSSPHAHDIFSLLTTQSYRWKKACLGLPPFAYHLLASMQDRLNCLQTLHLKHVFDNTSGSHTTTPTSVDEITVFESACNLKTVQLFDLPSTSYVRLPWPQLIDFCDDRRLAGTGLNQYFLDGLEAGKNLDMVGVIHRPSHENGSFPVLEERIVNTALKELHVCDGNFLRSVKLPNLTAISLEPHFNEELATLYECTSNVLQGLHDFILVSKCPLRHLFLISIEQGDGECLLAILDLTSSTLRELALIQHFTNTSTFPGLYLLLSRLKDQITDAKGNRQCAVVPHLSELSITLDRVFPTADLDQVGPLLVEVLMACWDCHEEPKLRSVTLKGKCSSIEASFDPRDVFKLIPKQVARLKEWENQGLNISVSVDDDGETIDILHNLH